MIKIKNFVYLFGVICLLISFSASARITHVMDYGYNLLSVDGTTSSCDGYLSSVPENQTCTPVKVGSLTCYTDCKCKNNYVKVDGVCTLNDCSAYPKTSCSLAYTTIEKCPTDSTKCKYTACTNGYTLNGGNCVCTSTGAKISGNSCVCDSSTGYKGTPPNCTPKGCTGDYRETTTSCDTGYTLSCSGYSGGKQCCKCTCTANTACTESAYPYTAANKPSSGSFENCDPGCGGAIRYRYKACPSSATTVTDCGLETGWTLVDAGITLANGTVCKQCSCSALMLGKIECPASSKCELMCNKTYYVVSTCADEGYITAALEATSVDDGKTGFMYRCMVGQMAEPCPYNEALYKCTGEAIKPTLDSCPTGYFLDSSGEESCNCISGVYVDGTKSDQGNTCYRCGTRQECSSNASCLQTKCDSCADGYFLNTDIETACACPYGIYNDGTTKSTASNKACFRCGTLKECGLTGEATACLNVSASADDSLKCHTGLSKVNTSSCSGGSKGTPCACGGTHTDDLYTLAHVCALTAQ